ncbi:MAG: hypothetical protein JXB48_21530 [Candidatus Latescibacteria bacterium]|nr:hypothetical protein [Candidatus Latescibacterota bacterium]
MTRIIIMVCIAMVLIASLCHTEPRSPVCYHISFDNLTFLDDCYVHQSGLKTPQERKLELVDGRFGKALYLGAIPLVYDDDNLSGIDLDLVTAVIYNVAMAQSKGTGYDEPFIWGTGKLHPAYGSIAFWVKGPLRSDMLFEQTSSAFGRLEKELLEIRLLDDGSIRAFVEDTRYTQHTIKTGPVWKADTWMHIVLTWDRFSGLTLWVNGKNEASSMGTDAWWDNQRPGLFHIPMAQATYDEFYIFDHPLNPQEIKRLYRYNIPPDSKTGTVIFDTAATGRMKTAFSADTSGLPVLTPSTGKALVFSQITPQRIHDEGISGWWLHDGRYECAWPHEYSIFTIVPGDADFHADKADILPPLSADVNYVTLEGNLAEVQIFKGDRSGLFDKAPIINIPANRGFFHGTTIESLKNWELRIPFTKSWGTPSRFEGDDVNLPLSGDLRLHEIGLFNVSEQEILPLPGDVKLFIDPKPVKLDGDRYPFALKALNPVFDRTVAGLYKNKGESTEKNTFTIPPATKLNLISEKFIGKAPYGSINIDMWVESPVENNVFLVMLLNPAMPSQLWSHAEVQFRGFSGEPQQLRLAIKVDPVFLVDGDRFWIQVCPMDGLNIITGDPERPASVTLRPCMDWVRSENTWSFRIMQPAIMTYSKMFEYMPWRITGRFPDINAPENFNGPFDMVYAWQAALKVNPGDRLGNIYKELVTNRYDNNSYPPEQKKFPRKTYDTPENAPDWAIYYRDFQSYRDRIITWWRHNQRSDGQVGGGWNDDTLVFSSDHGREGGYSDMILDSPPDAQILYNKVFDGFDKTNLFKGGYCRITPMDRLHNGDFIRERYKSLIYNLGDPGSAVWAMEEAWHLDKPEQTPVNYGDGSAFLFGKNVLEWYWGRKRVEKPYILENREALIAKLRRESESWNDTTLWRFTEARVHTDDQSPYGSDIMHNLLNGGFGVREKADGVYYTHVVITLGVGWLEGGGADLARLVEYSGNDGLKIHMYSFDAFDRKVTARLYRLDPGKYTITLRADSDSDGSYETSVSEQNVHIDRFGKLKISVPSQSPVLLEVKQIEADSLPGDLPDLAVSEHYITKQGNTLSITVHNIGCAPSGQFDVTVLDSENNVLKTIKAGPLDSPEDFVPKTVKVSITGLPKHDMYRIVVGRENKIREIFKENNVVELSCRDE